MRISNLYKLAVALCFASLMTCINSALADIEIPTKEANFKFDSKHRFSCGGFALIDVASEFEGHIEFYKADTDTLVCISGAVFGRCADGTICKCPPPEWDENGCWKSYGAFRKK